MKNPGCISFSFTFEDQEKGVMPVMERWKNQVALDEHLTQDHVISLFTKWAPKMRNEVKKYDVTNERNPRD